jgi:hypothetical protein
MVSTHDALFCYREVSGGRRDNELLVSSGLLLCQIVRGVNKCSTHVVTARGTTELFDVALMVTSAGEVSLLVGGAGRWSEQQKRTAKNGKIQRMN